MAAKVRIELNHEGIRQLLCSAPIAAECERHAQDIAARAGDGFEVKGDGGFRQRAIYLVVADTYEARYAEATEKTLSKAVRG